MRSDVSAFYKNQLAYRGIAALWVFLGHLLYGKVYSAGFASSEGWGVAGNVLLLHFLAVDGFFILSGCLLALNYWDCFTSQTTSKQIDLFYLRRLSRIYPLHLLGIVLIGLYVLVGIAHPISSGLEQMIFSHWQWTLVLNLAGMNAWGIVPVASWDEPAWTVSAMMFVYVLFPNLVLIWRKIDVRYYPLSIMLLLLGYFALRQWVPLGSNSDGAGALARALVFFTIGILMGRLYASRWRASWHWDGLLTGCLVAFVLCAALWWRVGPFDMLPFHALTIALMLCLLRADGVFSRLFANVITCWLGHISYALFIMHYPVLLLIKALFGQRLLTMSQGSDLGMVAAYVFTISSVIAVSFLVHRWFERPIDRWLKRQLND